MWGHSRINLNAVFGSVGGALILSVLEAHSGMPPDSGMLRVLESFGTSLSPQSACEAAPFDPSAANAFCADAWSYVCGDTNFETQFFDSLDAYAKWSEPSYQNLVVRSPAKKNKENYRAYIDGVYSDGIGTVSGLAVDWSTLNAWTEKTKQRLLQIIEKKQASAELKKDARARVEATSLMSLDEIAEDSNQRTSQFFKACDMGGGDGTASLITYQATGSRIILCPGFIAAIGRGSNDLEEFESRMEFILLHEMGHAIDGGEAKEKHACAQIFSSMLSEVPVEKREFNGTRRMEREVISDHLAFEGLLEKLSTVPGGRDDRARAIKVQYQTLCMATPDGDKDHPSPNWRVQFMATHPEIRKALGCHK